MAYHDLDPENPRALPSVETFHVDEADCTADSWFVDDDGDAMPGWYAWTCLPGCMPDSEPHGPHDTEDKALQSFRDLMLD